MPDGKIFLPLVSNNPQPPKPSPTPGTGQKIAIDPITRIEGHLRIEVQVENGAVTDAWSAATTFRGIETILKGRDPRDAWAITQRLCGVCTTVHAIASVRAVENALGITIPDNARLVRNLIEAAQFVQDHVIHFYHLHALDWVDIVSALSADPSATSALARSISDWPNSSPTYFTDVKNRLGGFVNSGQLGLFANGYWGHPAYRLSAEANLLAAAHYLEALDWQKNFIKVHALLGGKNPHPQTYLVGGIAIPLTPNSNVGINPGVISQIRTLFNSGLDFVRRVYMPDLQYIASQYKEWASIGAGPGNYLSYGDFPEDTSNAVSSLWLPQGLVFGKDLSKPPQPLDQAMIKEYIAHSWYTYASGDSNGLHPSQGETAPSYTGPQPPYDFLDTNHKYSWLKAPRYNSNTMEVGPLARMLVAYAAGHKQVRDLTNQLLSNLGVGPEALFSTLGRVAARGIETQVIAEKMGDWLNQLESNLNSGKLTIHNGAKWDPSTWPADASGIGMTEAPRGALGHWVHVQAGKIASYQMVVATAWNGSPRDASGKRGAWEEALIGTPVADPQNPVEVLRTIHSFDPCMACAVHLVDTQGNDLGDRKVQVHVR
jgi:[NiFe] hydrogenase large subunit/hydrogenase large subunit